MTIRTAKTNLRLSVSLLAFVLAVPFASSQESASPAADESQSDGQTQVELWEETLRFGIDAEIEALLGQIEQADVTELDTQVAQRFRRSRSTDLRVTIIEYFDRRDSPAIVDDVKVLLLGDEILAEDFVRVGSGYLSKQLSDYDPELIERYQEIAQDADVLTASIVIEAIGRSGAPSAVSRLLELYEELTQTDQRAAILRALGHTGSNEALPLLSQIARDEFEESALRHYATESLGRIGSGESVDLLTRLLADNDAVLRAYATRALGFYPSETSLSYLNEALLDSFWRVRVA
ncbi:MAG: HEAT repeat domain-containing protein, partial [Spirochaetales bacterium]